MKPRGSKAQNHDPGLYELCSYFHSVVFQNYCSIDIDGLIEEFRNRNITVLVRLRSMRIPIKHNSSTFQCCLDTRQYWKNTKHISPFSWKSVDHSLCHMQCKAMHRPPKKVKCPRRPAPRGRLSLGLGVRQRPTSARHMWRRWRRLALWPTDCLPSLAILSFGSLCLLSRLQFCHQSSSIHFLPLGVPDNPPRSGYIL
ncbi:hypothetical protein J6590_034682 [Homalodisca vitripennis]|nr:hypothetical protein J6590_034682 [Homalodisca vitripennis]